MTNNPYGRLNYDDPVGYLAPPPLLLAAPRPKRNFERSLQYPATVT